MNKRYNSKNSLENILQQTFEKLTKEKKTLLVEREEINMKLKKIEAFLKAASKNLNGTHNYEEYNFEEEEDSTSTPISTSASSKRYSVIKDVSELGNAKGGEIFLWGLQKMGNEATASEVAECVSKLKIESVKIRVEGENLSKLKQWLTVSADYLVKRKVLVKISRNDRKGGIAYRLK